MAAFRLPPAEGRLCRSSELHSSSLSSFFSPKLSSHHNVPARARAAAGNSSSGIGDQVARKATAVASHSHQEGATLPSPRCAIIDDSPRTSNAALLRQESVAAAEPSSGNKNPAFEKGPLAAAPQDLPRVAPESLSYPPGFLGAAPAPPEDGAVGSLGGWSGAEADMLAYLRRILTSRVYDVAVETPLELAPKLSSRMGNQIWLKREDMQPVFSFKLRGAYNMMAHLTPEQLARGVICSSAGNHAQGVALSAARLGCSAVIAMPVTTPEIKWRSVQRLGAEVVLVGDSYDATQAYAKLRAVEEGRVFIPPFDDPLVIAGQGTVGLEILRQFNLPACQSVAQSLPPPMEPLQPVAEAAGNGAAQGQIPSNILQSAELSSLGKGVPEGSACTLGPEGGTGADGGASCSCSLHAVFVPVGGGGLVAGIAAYLKALKPEIRVIGVEPADANAMAHSLQRGERVQLSSCGTFADGVAVRVVGEETFRICRPLLDGVVLVSRDAICAAIKDMFEETRSILEPAGALSVAGAKAYCDYYGLRGAHVVAVTSGANMNFDRLRLVAELADVGAKREAVVGTILKEAPGAFRAFAEQLSPSMNVTEFKYRYSNPDRAYVLFSVGLHRPQELSAMISRLEAADMPTVDLTDNDLAKDHLRHLVGGKSLVPYEALFRIIFPERPGALIKFLDALSPRWNITLFHYRRQGEMGANILVGLQILPDDEEEFFNCLEDLGYDYTDERQNTALRMFMQ